jgi:transcriptional regulator with XRE-family HTH domain
LPVEFVVTTSPQFAEEFSDIGDSIREVHDLNVTPFGGYATLKDDVPEKDDATQTGRMTNWVQLPAFVKRVETFQAEHGMTHAQVAKELGVVLSTLRNWLYGTKTPGFKKKQRAAQLFGCDVNEFIDNPGAPRLTSIDTKSAPEIQRFQNDQALRILSDERLTDEDRQTLIEDLNNRAMWMVNLKIKKNL